MKTISHPTGKRQLALLITTYLLEFAQAVFSMLTPTLQRSTMAKTEPEPIQIYNGEGQQQTKASSQLDASMLAHCLEMVSPLGPNKQSKYSLAGPTACLNI